MSDIEQAFEDVKSGNLDLIQFENWVIDRDDDSYQDGYENGHAEGHSDGYSIGYEDGFDEAGTADDDGA